MSRNVGSVFISPTFLVADSAEKLHKLMLKNNVKWRSQFVYTSIYESKGKHYAWFNFDHRLLKENDTSEND